MKISESLISKILTYKLLDCHIFYDIVEDINDNGVDRQIIFRLFDSRKQCVFILHVSQEPNYEKMEHITVTYVVQGYIDELGLDFDLRSNGNPLDIVAEKLYYFIKKNIDNYGFNGLELSYPKKYSFKSESLFMSFKSCSNYKKLPVTHKKL